jgi:uncharacterized protein (DUF433 family)
MALPSQRETRPRQVVHDPRILDGEPTLQGTRVPVRSVVLAVRFSDDVDEVLEAYPMLDRASVAAALAYYDRHRDEIDRHIAENDDRDE